MLFWLLRYCIKMYKVTNSCFSSLEISFPLLTPKEILKIYIYTHTTASSRVMFQHFSFRHLCILRCGEPVTFCKAKRFVSGTLGGVTNANSIGMKDVRRCGELWIRISTQQKIEHGRVFCLSVLQSILKFWGSFWMVGFYIEEIKCIKQKRDSGG